MTSQPRRSGTTGPAAATGTPLAAEAVVTSLRTSSRSATLDRLAALAARLLEVASAEVALMDSVRTVVGAHSPFPSILAEPAAAEDSLCAHVQRDQAAVAIADTALDARARDVPLVKEGLVRSYLGVPLVLESGDLVGVLCVFDPEPKAWDESDHEVLASLASVCASELELEALQRISASNQVVLDLALTSAGVGVFEWDVKTGELEWDERLRSLFGYTDDFDRTMAAFQDRVHPEDLGMVTAALDAAVSTCGVYSAEYRVVLPSGVVHHLAARGRVFADAEGSPERLLGAVYDMTPSREEEARIGKLLESMALGFIYLDDQWRTVQVNSEAERILGVPRSAVVGEDIWRALPAMAGTSFEDSCRRALDLDEVVSFETYYPYPLAAWFEVRATPEAGGLAVYFLDITAHKAAQQASERAVSRSSLLADVAAELAGALELSAVVDRLPSLLVPALADWCALTWLEDGTEASPGRHTNTWHSREDRLGDLEHAIESRMSQPSIEALMREVLDAPRPTILPGGSNSLRESSTGLLDDLGSELALALPLRGRKGPLGLLLLGWEEAPDGRRSDFFGLASEVADQVGLSLDNARLYARQRTLAETMQRSLLTEPVEPDHLQIAVRYTPAAKEAQVGGDWYDAFLMRDGSTTLVVGDVSGHDQNAAALMAQVRNILRGVAHALPGSPGQVLSALDRALADLGVGVLATAILARVEQDQSEACQGLRRLKWSNAGHPPPLLVHAQGSVEVLDHDADLLLGFDPRTSRMDHEHTLEPGATLLFYTDGLVERRDSTLDLGIARLVETASELSSLDLESFCDALLERLARGSDDDVVLLAVRAHPEDRPRPPEAGPLVLPDDLRSS